MKKKYLCMFILALTVLTGCTQDQVAYEGDSNPAGQEETGGVETDETGTSQEIGDKWEESIATSSGKNINVNAQITMPEAADLSILEVSEYYYTPEDKKKVAETLFDAGSQNVDTEKALSKERLQKEISEWDEMISGLSEKSGTEEGIQKEKMVAENEKKRLENLVAEAPDMASIAEEPGDYSQNYYKGTRDGYNYFLSFDIDEERNRSSWVFEVGEDIVKFNKKGLEGCNEAALVTNESSMTKEEVEQKAVAVCEELGLSNMVPLLTGNLKWVGNNINDTSFEGYCVTLTRGIGGDPVDADEYYENDMSDAYSMYIDTEQATPPYATERVVVKLTDTGIFYMEYTGILTEGKTENSVKLLGIDQIKDVYREQIKESNNEFAQFDNLDLIYLRIKSDQEENTYSYIPVWRLSASNMYNGYTISTRWNCLLLNAIDGSVIDAQVQGLSPYFTPERLKELSISE